MVMNQVDRNKENIEPQPQFHSYTKKNHLTYMRYMISKPKGKFKIFEKKIFMGLEW